MMSTYNISKMNKDAQMRATINQKLIETGERERLKELLRAKLIECGWKDQLKAHCKDVIKEKGLEHVTVDDLVAEITPKGRDEETEENRLSDWSCICTSS
uniref:Transcription and mRNA export factor ENY2 n=1 Tax=Monodelphis domestica TaxID=13616 RepID=A0A5F8G7J8_MONDO